jgi:hypothetical protein
LGKIVSDPNFGKNPPIEMVLNGNKVVGHRDYNKRHNYDLDTWASLLFLLSTPSYSNVI